MITKAHICCNIREIPDANRLLLSEGRSENEVATTKTFVTFAMAKLALLAHWKQDKRLIDTIVELPEHLDFAKTSHPLTDPLALIVSFHAFFERLSVERGINPNLPRNLTKVTETV